MTGDSRAESSLFVDNWLTARNFCIGLAVLIFAMFPEVVLGQRTFFFRDFSIFGYSWASYHRAAFWEGSVPLWNPLSNCGIPFLAQWNTMTLYPLSIIYLALPLSISVGYFCLFHMWLAGVGMFALALRWTGSRFAAAFAGIAFAFSGLLLNSLAWPNNIAALAWMPWVVWFGEDLRSGFSRRGLLAPIAGAAQMLAGAPEVTMLSWILYSTLWLEGWLSNKGQRVKIFGRFIFFGTSVASLCAAQLLPFLDLLTHSQRDANYGVGLWPMPWWGVGNFFVPLLFTFPWGAGVYFQYDQYWTTSYYVGIATAALALTSFYKPRGRWLALVILLVATLVLALGEKAFVFAWLRKAIPIFGVMRYPIKLIVLAEFIVPLLAALALSRLGENPNRRLLMICGGIGLGTVLVCLLVGKFFPIYNDPEYNRWTETRDNGLTRGVLLIAFLAAVGALPKIPRPQTRVIFGSAALILLWIDLRTHVPAQNPTVGRDLYDSVDQARGWAGPPRAGVSRAMPSPFAESTLHNKALAKVDEDFMRKRLGLYCNLNLIEGVSKVNGVFSLFLREAAEFETALYKVKNPSPALMDFLGVEYLTASNSTIVWDRRTNFMPLVTSGQKPVFIEKESLRALQEPNVDLRQVVVLSASDRSLVNATNGSAAKITAQKFAADKIEFQAEGAEPTLVVVSQSYYHWWHAYIDGKREPLLRANHAFQTLQVPAGTHRVQIRYEDDFFRVGSVISIASTIGFAVFFYGLRPKKRERN